MSITITPNAGAAPFPTQGGVGAAPGYGAIDVRRVWHALYREGALTQGAYKAHEATAAPNLTVEVDADQGAVIVEGDTLTPAGSQGSYYVAPHGSMATLSWDGTDAPAPDATNPRIDRIVLRVYDGDLDGSGLHDAVLDVLDGAPTVGASLDDPEGTGAQAIPDTTWHIADVRVPANATELTTADIRDYRTYGGREAEPGDYKFTGGAAGPGWAEADFAEVNRLVHHRLFAAIGTDHGPGDGSLTFNRPDGRGRVPVGAGGVDAGRLTAGNSPGDTGGTERHTLTAAESGLPAHDHHMDAVNLGGSPPGEQTSGGKTHIKGATAGGGADRTLPAPVNDGAFFYGLGVGGVVGGAKNASQAHNNMPPHLVGRWLVFTGSVAA